METDTQPETPQQTPQVKDLLSIEIFVVLGLVFTVLIGLSLISVFGQTGFRAEPSMMVEESSARTALLQEGLVSYGAEASPKQAALLRKSTTKSYDSIIEDIAKKDNNKETHKLMVGLSLAAGKPAPLKDLNVPATAPPEVLAALKLAADDKNPGTVESVAAWKPKAPIDRMLRLGALRHAGAENRIGQLVEPGSVLAFGTVAGIAGLVFACGGVVVLLVLVNWGKFKASMRGFACGPVSNVMASELALRATVFLLLYVGSSLPFALIPALKGLPEVPSTLLRGATILAVALLSAGVPLFGRGGLGRIWGKVPTAEGIKVALAGLCANAPVLALTLPLVLLLSKVLPAPTHPINAELAKGTGIWETVAILVVGSIFAPMAEETVFRGMLFPAFSKLTGSVVWGGLLQGFCFAAIHPQGPAAWISLMSIGCMCAVITYRAGCQWPSMVVHGLHNGIILLLNVTLNNL